MNKRLRPNDPKICAHCGGDFYRNPKVSYKVWDKQKHCSKICSNKAGASFGGNVLTRLGQVLEVEKKRAIQEDTIGIVNLINLEV